MTKPKPAVDLREYEEEKVPFDVVIKQLGKAKQSIPAKAPSVKTAPKRKRAK